MLSKAAFVCALLFNVLLVVQNGSDTPISQAGSLVKRSGSYPAAFRQAWYEESNEDDLCAPLSVPVSEQCHHVIDQCDAHATSLHIPYMRGYFCATAPERPAVATGLAFWLFFLFSTLGIVASDFFCPNLATIASVLGLDETVAGVTFLAFGNGSPDLFSTFSAMKAGSGSLAIGELVGAASFITTVVVGSLCIIKPFQVPRWSFLRDVGFFTTAIALLLLFCVDGNIHLWEAGLLVVLYVVYVFVVVVGTWWEHRMELRRAREQQIRAEYASDNEEEMEPYQDDVTAGRPSLQVITTRPRAISNPNPMARSPSMLSVTPSHRNSGLSIPARLSSSEILQPQDPALLTPSVQHNMPSFSLLGALEFRDVITALRSQSNEASLDVFENPTTPQAETRIERLRRLRSGSFRTPTRNQSEDTEVDPWDSALGMPLSTRRSFEDEPSTDVPHLTVSTAPLGVQLPNKADPVSRSSTDVTATSPTLAQPQEEIALGKQLENVRVRPTLAQQVYRTLFPSLQNFGSKSWVGRIAAVLCIPALFALTITLPVVVTSDSHSVPEPLVMNVPEIVRDGRLIDLDTDVEAGADQDAFSHMTDEVATELCEGLQDVLLAEEEVLEAIHGARYNKWLTATQCIFGPLLCWAVLLAGRNHAWLILLGTVVVSTAVAVLVVIFSDKGNDPAGRTARTFLGFAIAIVWIMAIADEVVAVLQTFGHMFGLSDAIIGLTVFAVGNSLADFVADLSVAAFAPLMAFAACFGGPMLNILLGVGLSGTYVITESGAHSYHLEFSTTLLVSSVGLLSMLLLTMIIVPLNGYRLTRRWGVFLICYYIVIMTTNIVVEVMRL